MPASRPRAKAASARCAETDYATWLRVFNVNLFSTALLARGPFAELKAAQGTVINVTSIAGSKVHPFAGVAYATSRRRCPR